MNSNTASLRHGQLFKSPLFTCGMFNCSNASKGDKPITIGIDASRHVVKVIHSFMNTKLGYQQVTFDVLDKGDLKNKIYPNRFMLAADEFVLLFVKA